MARYLERLIARTDMTVAAAPVAPQPRMPFGRDLSDAVVSDPFEAADASMPLEAVWPVQGPVEPRLASQRANEGAGAAPIRETWQKAAPGSEHDVRIERIIASDTTPAMQPQTDAPAVLGQGLAAHADALPVLLEAREVHTESIRVEAVNLPDRIDAMSKEEGVEPETTPAKRVQPVDTSGIESGIFNRLMPMLDAWFTSEAAPNSADAPPQMQPMVPATEPLMPPASEIHAQEPVSRVEVPQLVIGSIHVEVTRPAVALPGPVSRPAPRASARAARPSSVSSTSRLSFGLGQM